MNEYSIINNYYRRLHVLTLHTVIIHSIKILLNSFKNVQKYKYIFVFTELDEACLYVIKLWETQIKICVFFSVITK